ncbi:hypothetical protein HYX01_03955 [Candidatus Woesearchaeota archaeon]|nr:hypothetical protein [Candidatus Woesearchaeota archaeon]
MKTSQDTQWAKQQRDRALNERVELAALRKMHDGELNYKKLLNPNILSDTISNNPSYQTLDRIVLNTPINPADNANTSPSTPEISQIGYANPIKTYWKRFASSAKSFALLSVAAAIFITGCDTSEMVKLAYNLKNPVEVKQEGSVRIERYKVREDM